VIGRRVYGFEFALSRAGESLGWHRVQGHGGLFGDGCLYRFDNGGEPSGKLLRRLRGECARMVQSEGYALVLVDPDAAPSERHTKLKGVEVTDIRPLIG
jgi:hypothetical protein